MAMGKRVYIHMYTHTHTHTHTYIYIYIYIYIEVQKSGSQYEVGRGSLVASDTNGNREAQVVSDWMLQVLKY
jgi:hypothetical protein